MKAACLILLLTSVVGRAFVLLPQQKQYKYPTILQAETVQVCGFKDCRRVGGGAKLEKLVKEIVDEKGLSTTVEICDCQGECGYGPNLVVDGKLINGVRGKEAVLQALGVE
jgi:NADH:ubiquinone oxidoreductase subunit E